MKSQARTSFEIILIATIIVAIVLLPQVVSAQGGQRQGPPAFSEIDADGDGYISAEEFAAHRAERQAAMSAAGKPMKGAAFAPAFDEIDTDGDGRLDQAELAAGQQAHRKAMREAHGTMPGSMRGGMGMPAFSDLDSDGNGCIDAAEFAAHQAAARHHQSE